MTAETTTNPYAAPATDSHAEAPQPRRSSAKILTRLVIAVFVLGGLLAALFPYDFRRPMESFVIAGPMWGIRSPGGYEQTVGYLITGSFLLSFGFAIVFPRWYMWGLAIASLAPWAYCSMLAATAAC